MAQRDKKKAHLRGDIPNPGIGLFVDDRAKASADEAYAWAVDNLEKEGFSEKNADLLQQRLLETSRHYWVDYDFDNRTTSIEIRNEIVSLQCALKQIVDVISGNEERPRVETLSADARAALRAAAQRVMRGAGGDPVDALMAQVMAMQKICRPITAVRGKKGPQSRDRVTRCCARLWDLREGLTGRPFAKSLAPDLDDVGTATSRFASPDAQFVLAVMKSIDKKVSFSQVLDGLRRHPVSKSRKK